MALLVITRVCPSINNMRFSKGVESRKFTFFGATRPSHSCERFMICQASCVSRGGRSIPTFKIQGAKGMSNKISAVPKKQDMDLFGKMIMYVGINTSANELYDIVRYRPNDLATMLPDKVHGCYLVDGDWGAVGSVICWNFIFDGKVEVIKQEVVEVDDATHKIVFNVLESKLLEGIYKSFKFVFHVEPDSNGKLAAVTFEFEKENLKMPYPTDFMDYLRGVYRDVDNYYTTLQAQLKS